MRVKICGITRTDQGQAIAQLGATAIGFICVHQSPRYVTPAQIQAVVEQLPASVDTIGVFANASTQEISQIVANTKLTGVQLHGKETPEFCYQLRQSLPQVEIIKALQIKTSEDLNQVELYNNYIDTLLLDAYHPQMLGGTGKTLDWKTLQQFNPKIPWLLAGGLTPDNILECLGQIHPNGIDLSSGVEHSPGNKDLNKVAQLFNKLLTI